VALSSQATPDQWRNYHLVVLGRPTRNPYIMLVNNELPQPFIPGRDEIRQQVDTIIYRLPPGYDLGYIQLLPVPWDEARAMLVVSGTTDAGLRWAMRALTDGRLVRRLDGNLAVLVQEEEMRTTDTRQSTSETGVDPTPVFALTPEATVTPPPTAAVTATMPGSPITPTITSGPGASTFPPIGEEVRGPDHRRLSWMIPLLGLGILVVIISVGIAVWQSRS
jgi:hypothetical protein